MLLLGLRLNRLCFRPLLRVGLLRLLAFLLERLATQHLQAHRLKLPRPALENRFRH